MADKKAKTIYDLELHETLNIIFHSSYHFTTKRVPGGWIYTTAHCKDYIPITQSSVFVPYNTEFQPHIQKDDKPKKLTVKEFLDKYKYKMSVRLANVLSNYIWTYSKNIDNKNISLYAQKYYNSIPDPETRFIQDISDKEFKKIRMMGRKSLSALKELIEKHNQQF